MIRRLTNKGRQFAAKWGHHTHTRTAGFKTHPSPSERRKARLQSRAQANRYANKQRIAICIRTINRTCQVLP